MRCNSVAQAELCYLDPLGAQTAIQTINAGFEAPDLPTTPHHQGANYYAVPENEVPGWETDEPTGIIELWRSPAVGGHTAYEGLQLAELNYLGNTRLFQTLRVPARAVPVRWEWAHGSRNGTGDNRAQMLLGDASTDYTTHTVVSDDTRPANTPNQWEFLSGVWNKPAGITEIVVSLQAILPAVGFGNLVDAVKLSVGVSRAVRIYDCGAEGRWINSVDGSEVDESLLFECEDLFGA